MPDIQEALDSIIGTSNAYNEYNNYYDGKHRLSFATQDFQNAFGSLFKAFALNMMPPIVDCVRDRLKLSGFTTGKKSRIDFTESEEDSAIDSPMATEPIPDPVDAKILDIWRHNRMDQRSGRVHLNALKAGDSYVIIWPDAQMMPVIYPNKAQNISVLYDDEQPGRIIRACKAWVGSDKLAYLTLYYEDRIEKYVTSKEVQGGLPDKAASFVQRSVDGEAWPLINPYDKVPVFHFANNADIGERGVSELKDAIPLQNGLNKSVCDMLVCEEYHSMPQRWATGIELPTDPKTGQPLNPFLPGEFWAAKAKEASFGQMDAANLEQFIKVKNSWKEDIASVSGTPLHYFNSSSGTPPSGESLKTLESRLTSKVEDRQVSFGNCWEDIFKFALLIAGMPDEQLDAVWENTQPRDETAQLANSVIKVDSLGGSVRQAWREQGYSDEEIDEIFKERKAEDNAKPLADVNPTNKLGADLSMASKVNGVARADARGTQLVS